MPIISKDFRLASCSQLFHPWCEGCFETFFKTLKTGFKESIKIYGVLYLLSSIITGKKLKYLATKVPFDVLRSSTFLSLNGALFSGSICLIRRLTKFNNLSIAFIPAVISSAIAISVERNARRQQLTVYMMNIAIQTIFNMLKSRKMIKSFDNGEVALFSIAAAGLMFLFVEKRAPSYITKFLGFIFGYSELSMDSQEMGASGDVIYDFKEKKSNKSKFSILFNSIFDLLHNKLNISYTSLLCNHEVPCIQYAAYGFNKPFAIGVIVQYCIIVLKNIRYVLRSPLSLLKYFLKRNTYNLGVFLGLFSLIFRVSQCCQKRCHKLKKLYFPLVSGLVAGLANKMYPSVNISMYSMSKLIELCCRSYLSKIDILLDYNSLLMILLYSLSTASVFHAAILEPTNVPKTYLNFLQRMTNGRISDIDRGYLDVQ